MNELPTTTAPDSTLAMLREGYRFIPNRMRQLETNIFSTRILGKPAICVSGQDAAAMFYHPNRFTRQNGAMPITTVRLLQDVGSVQQLDADAHEHRKRMFMGMMTAENMARMIAITERVWEQQLASWTGRDQIVLFDEAEHILTIAASEWIGAPVAGKEARQLTDQYSSMIKGAGSVGPTALRGLLLRRRTEAWMRDRITEVREGKRDAPEDAPLHVFATSRDLDGDLLPVEIAAIETINITRPIVAVGRFIAFVGYALEKEPESRDLLTSGDHDQATWFTNEVRRHYPFFPFIGGIVREGQGFDWQGHHFGEGQWVLLDIYGTNHDPAVWDYPQAFMPRRFRDAAVTPFNLIPQGAGEDWLTTHRCPGEWLTIKLIRQAALFLTARMRYSVPDQDMSVSLHSFPGQPKSGMILRDIHPA